MQPPDRKAPVGQGGGPHHHYHLPNHRHRYFRAVTRSDGNPAHFYSGHCAWNPSLSLSLSLFASAFLSGPVQIFPFIQGAQMDQGAERRDGGVQERMEEERETERGAKVVKN